MVNGSIIALSTIICLALAEVVLEVFLPSPAQVGAGTVSTEKARIYGWAYPPGITMMSHNPDTGEVTSIFKANSEGWKDVEHTRAKPAGAVRILILGDSHTFGIPGLDKLYTRRLEAILHERGFSNVEVITIALPGWSTDQELLALEKEGVEYQPDFVIYQFCENDYDGNVNDNSKYFDKGFVKPFLYKLVDDKLIKEDKTEAFLSYMARKNSEWSTRKLLQKSALYQRAVLAIDRLQIWNEKQSDKRKSLSQNPLIPDFGNLENLGRREFNDEDWDLYKKNFKEEKWNKVLLARKIIKRQTNKRLGFILPAYDPFVYEAGKFSKLETYAWDLMDALLARFKEVSGSVGAEFLVFSEDGEQGKT